LNPGSDRRLWCLLAAFVVIDLLFAALVVVWIVLLIES
jgi:hypothetical protein